MRKEIKDSKKELVDVRRWSFHNIKKLERIKENLTLIEEMIKKGT